MKCHIFKKKVQKEAACALSPVVHLKYKWSRTCNSYLSLVINLGSFNNIVEGVERKSKCQRKLMRREVYTDQNKYFSANKWPLLIDYGFLKEIWPYKMNSWRYYNTSCHCFIIFPIPRFGWGEENQSDLILDLSWFYSFSLVGMFNSNSYNIHGYLMFNSKLHLQAFLTAVDSQIMCYITQKNLNMLATTLNRM